MSPSLERRDLIGGFQVVMLGGGMGTTFLFKKINITKMDFSFIDVVITNIPRTVWRKPI